MTQFRNCGDYVFGLSVCLTENPVSVTLYCQYGNPVTVGAYRLLSLLSVDRSYYEFLLLNIVTVVIVYCRLLPHSICAGMTHSVKIKMHGTIILTVVLYGCENWLLTLREKCRLRVFENRMLRRIFGPKTNRAMRGWRRLHNKELYACTPHQISFG